MSVWADVGKYNGLKRFRESLVAYSRWRPGWWIGVAGILVIAAALRLSIYSFSLPYIDHPDEPSFYLKALEWRGQFSLPNWHEGYPPAYIALNVLVQVVLEALGQSGLAATMPVLRLLAVMANLLTALFIMLIARLAAGNWAGWVAGLAWSISPSIVENGVLATPDPFVYLLVVFSLWLALVALYSPRQRHWCVWSTVAGLLAFLFKYPVIIALAPGGLVALWVLLKDRRRGMRYLALQMIMGLAVAVWLLFVYRIGRFTGYQASVAREEGLVNLLKPERFIGQLYYAVYPLTLPVFLIACGLGLVALIVALRRGWTNVLVGALALCLLLFISIPWLAASFSTGSLGRLRDVLPATAVGCIILGIAAQQVIHVLDKLVLPPRPMLNRAAIGGLFSVSLFIPQFLGCVPIVQDRQREDWRVYLRRWADLNLEPGLFLVNDENHKTFNPYWGGIPGRKWFDWLVVDDFTANSPVVWREQHGVSYMALPVVVQQEMQTTEAGRASLAQMLHLRTFAAPPSRRGPEVAVYRLWRMMYELNARFDGRITLLGYDVQAEHPAPGDTVTLRFYWRATSLPRGNYSLYIHLTPLDSRKLVAQADGVPVSPERPTLSWDDPGETLIGAPLKLTVPADLAPGTYRLVVGLYDYITGARLLIESGDDSVELFKLTVPEKQSQAVLSASG